MNFLKLGLALSLVAAFGFVACDDSSSADSGDGSKVASCKSSYKDSVLTIKADKGDYSFTSTTKIENGIITSKLEFNVDVPEEECNRETLAREEHFQVECKGKTITEKSEEKMTAEAFDNFTNLLIEGCKAIDGKKIEKKDVKEALECKTDGAVRDTVVAGIKGSATCKDGVWVVDPNSIKKDESTATDNEDDKVDSGDNNTSDNDDNPEDASSSEDAGATTPGEE